MHALNEPKYIGTFVPGKSFTNQNVWFIGLLFTVKLNVFYKTIKGFNKSNIYNI